MHRRLPPLLLARSLRDGAVELPEAFGHARAVGSAERLPVARSGVYGRFSLTRLGAHEVVVLEER